MLYVERAAKDWLLLLKHHRKVAASAFAAGTVLFLATGLLWPKYYSGSALIAATASTASAQPTGGGLDAPSLLLVHSPTQQEWTAMVTRLHLYPEIVADRGTEQAAEYLASQVSLQRVSIPRLGRAALQIAFTGRSGQTVTDVVSAVADSLTQPMPAPDGAVNQPAPDPLYAPVVLPAQDSLSPPPTTGPVDKRHPRGETSAARTATLDRKLAASVADGSQLQKAVSENAMTLIGLGEERIAAQKHHAAALAAKLAPRSDAPPERKPESLRVDPQADHLRQDLAHEQANLARLRDRYTDEYPDVVAARNHINDLQLDMARLAAAAPRAAKAAAPPAVAAVPEQPAVSHATENDDLIDRQLQQAEAARDRLQEAMQRNTALTAQLKARIAQIGPASSSIPGPPLPLPVAAVLDRTESTADLASPAQDTAASLNPPSSESNHAAKPAQAVLPPTFFLVQPPVIAVSPFVFAGQVCWFFSLAFGVCIAILAVWLAEQRDPSIRNEAMLRHELPTSAVYLGGIPRIRHDVIAD